MKFKFPKFKGGHCIYLTACANIRGPKVSDRNWLSEYQEVQGRFGPKGGLGFVRILKGKKSKKEGNSRYHFHVDIASSLYFATNQPITQPIGEAHAIFSRVSGYSAIVNILGHFVIKRDEASPLITTYLVTTKAGSISMSMTGATFEFQGAPVESATWSIIEKTGDILVKLFAKERKMNIDENYLVNCFDFINELAEPLVFKKP